MFKWHILRYVIRYTHLISVLTYGTNQILYQPVTEKKNKR